MNANQAKFPVRTMCQVLDVSTSGFYDWSSRAPSARSIANAVLAERVEQIHKESHHTYGRPRIKAELAAQGVGVGNDRIARLMKSLGIRGLSKRKSFTVTTTRAPENPRVPDLVNRNFVADGPNQLWVADMTYVPTWAGFIYLAIVLDVWSRRVVGWSIGEHMRAELVLAALNMALEQRRPQNVIHHSDQGSQYTSVAFGKRCQEMRVRPSTGSVGDAYDNAMAESFFGTLENELIERRSFKSKAEARMALFTYIEGWYNPKRRHSGIQYMSPAEFERKHAQNNDQPKSDAIETGLTTVGACVASATPPVDNPLDTGQKAAIMA